MKKKVLFISISFFNYEKHIIESIKKLGYDVDFYDERVYNNSIFKAINRVNKNLIKRINNNYFLNIFKETKHKQYDFLFVIKGEIISKDFINLFKRNNPKAKLIYYTFDSIKNNPNSLKILKYFDKCYSFDFQDVKKYPNLILKHLFFTSDFRYSNEDKFYNISFIGTLHSNRYELIKGIIDKFKDHYIYFFSQAKWYFFLKKIFNKDSKNISYKDVKFEKLSLGEVADIFKKSKCVIDVQRYNQTGLTMRTFEVLAANCILVTTNNNILKLPDIDLNKIVIIDFYNLELTIEKIENKLNHQINNLDNKFYEKFLFKYNIDNWVKDFFD